MTLPAGGYADLAAATTDGLVHYWPMDEASGAVVADMMGVYPIQAYNMNDVAATIAAGKFGNCRTFPAGVAAANSSLGVAPVAGAPLHFAWTVALWWRPDDLSVFPFVADFGETTRLRAGVNDTDGSVWVDVLGQSSSDSSTLAAGTLTTGQWALFVWTYLDGGEGTGPVTLYVNGAAVWTTAVGDYALRVVRDIADVWKLSQFCGLQNSAAAIVGCSADEAAFWSRDLSAAEVTTLYNGGSGIVLLAPEPPPEHQVTIAATFDDMTASLRAVLDWTAALDPLAIRIYYAMVLTGAENSLADIRVPISSWQATIQQGRADYVQAVVPAALDHLDDINARPDGQVVIYRGALLSDGSTIEQEMARAPASIVRFDQGARRATVTLSGYATPGTYEDPGKRTLAGVRSLSIDSAGIRARSDIDWLLRPGMTAQAGAYTLDVAYINYYVGQNDAYMDVGERANG